MLLQSTSITMHPHKNEYANRLLSQVVMALTTLRKFLRSDFAKMMLADLWTRFD